MGSVYCAVRTPSLNRTDYVSSLEGFIDVKSRSHSSSWLIRVYLTYSILKQLHMHYSSVVTQSTMWYWKLTGLPIMLPMPVSLCSVYRLDFLMVRLCSPWGTTPNFIHSMAVSFADFRMAVSQTRERITLATLVHRGEFPQLTRGQVCEARHERPHLWRASPVAT